VLAQGVGRVALFYANRDERSVIFRDTLNELARAHPERLQVLHWLDSVQGVPTVPQLAAWLRPWSTSSAASLFVCGPGAFMDATVQAAAATLKAPATELQARIGQVMEQVRALEKEVAALKGKLASSQGDELVSQAVDVKGMKVLAATLVGADAKTLRETMDKLKDKLKSAAIVLAAVDGGKVQIAAGVTADRMGQVKAGELANFVAQQVGGKGGGKADMAMAGGTDASALPAALKSVQAWVAERA